MTRRKFGSFSLRCWPLLALLSAGCVGELPPLSPAPVEAQQPVLRKAAEPPVSLDAPSGSPSVARPPQGVTPSLSPSTLRQPFESTPPPAYPAPAPGQFANPPNNGPVTGYGLGGMQPMPGTPPNPPYTYRTTP